MQIIAERIMDELVSFCKVHFELPDSWSVDMSFNYRSARSCGGKRLGKCIIQVGAKELTETRMTFFNEYSSFASSRQIGMVSGCTPEQYLTVLLAHEIAHCVQFELGSKQYAKHKLIVAYGTDAGHGKLFQAIYRIIRMGYANSRLGGCKFGDQAKAGGENVAAYIPKCTEHPLVGKTFHHPKYGTAEIIDFRSRMRSAPVIFKAGNKLLRTSVSQAQTYLAA